MCTHNDEKGHTDAQHQKGHWKLLLAKIQYKKCVLREPYQTYTSGPYQLECNKKLLKFFTPFLILLKINAVSAMKTQL